ncbi:hypothetical protein PAMA_013870 [Pampus argenteus]
MFSELECGICYRTFNAGLRCPRELHCKHSFCHSCLRALSRPHRPEEERLGAAIVCPLCRHTSSISGEIREELRMDESVLERLLAEGVLDREDDPEEEEETEDDGQVQGGCDETDAEESDSSVGSSGGKLRRSWRKIWRKISGKRGGETECSNTPTQLICLTSKTWIDNITAAYCKSQSYETRRMLSIMLGTFSLCSRLMFVFVLVCATVMSLIMCSDDARAGPITVQVKNGVKHNILRSPYSPYKQNRLFSTSLLSTETGLQTSSDSETEMSEKPSVKGTLSIIDHQSKPLWLTKNSFHYNQNSPDNRVSQVGVNVLSRGHNAGDVRPASSIFIQPRGLSPKVNYYPFSQKVAQTGSPYLSPAIIRKSAHVEAASPFDQRSSLLKSWDPKDAQKSYNKRKVTRSDSPSTPVEDKTVWQPSYSSLFSSQTGRYQSGSQPTSRGHYGGYKETNERAVAGAWSGGKFFSFATQTAPHVPSVSKRLDSSVIKHNPRPEKLPPSVTGFSQGLYSVTNNETPRHKKFQSYLFKDSKTSSSGREAVNTVTEEKAHGLVSFSATPNRQRDANVPSRLSLNLKQQSHRKDPTKEEQHFSKVTQYGGGQTGSFTKYQPVSSIYLLPHTTTQTPAHVPSTAESFVPVPPEDFQGKYATVASSLVSTTTRASVNGYKPGQSMKRIYGFRGFKKESREIFSRSATDGKAPSRRYSSDKGKGYTFKIVNKYPSLSQKYSFSQRRSSSMTTTPTPAKTETTPTEVSGPGNTSPSPGRLGGLQTTTVSTPTLVNPDHRQPRGNKTVYGLKGFGTRPLSTTTSNQVEGAKTSVNESDNSAVLPSFRGFKHSQTLQPKSNRIHRWHNQTVESDATATQGGNELSGLDLKPFLTSGTTESTPRFTPDKYKKNHKIYSLTGFESVQNRIGKARNKTHWNHQAEQSPTPRFSSAYLRSAGDPMKPAMKASLFNSSTRSTVRGKRVKGKHGNNKKLDESTATTNNTRDASIVRLPKRPAKVKAVIYSDILGSASFSGVGATTQTPITAADKDFLPNTTAATKQKGGTSSNDRPLAVDKSMGEKDHGNSAEDEVEDISVIEETKFSDGEVKASNSFLDIEGSSDEDQCDDLFVPTVTDRLSKEMLEFLYLRSSTGNVSFTSIK